MNFDSRAWNVSFYSNGMHRRYSGALWLLILAMGCEDSSTPTYPVSGTITFKDQPIPEGSIAFIPQDGRTPHATQIVNGNYDLSLPAGTQKVVIEASKFVGPVDKVMGLRPRDQFLPDRYNIESILSVEVNPEQENKFSFDLDE